ncbi:hypothetical protein [Sphingobium sp. RAC03]|uniref:hypothetical protein n=1 Tax=Sphingobium sp. RAC03 TaxID=1843368 RepID=UPI00083CDCE3|nr:hypothetical protein [Sphingobium sp. RAC03]AOF96986.1 hypothetical protein BSY17_2639 [Sphingobium sp. RAC03]
MIVWSDSSIAATVTPAFIDNGATVRGATNAAGQRIDRLGSHYRAAITLGVGSGLLRAALISDLIRAKQEGLRLPYPLNGVDQGSPGAPVMNGANQAGRIIQLRGLTPGYVCNKGYWLSIQNAAGQHYLHNVHGPNVAGGDGTMAITLTEHLREPFADGAAVHLAQPMIEGEISGNEQSWQIVRGARVVGIGFTIEEMG